MVKEIHRGDWVDPDHVGVTFGNYASQWLQDRVLKVRTKELNEGLLRNHFLPTSRAIQLSDVDAEAPVIVNAPWRL
jgi:hypothetical protein